MYFPLLYQSRPACYHHLSHIFHQQNLDFFPNLLSYTKQDNVIFFIELSLKGCLLAVDTTRFGTFLALK